MINESVRDSQSPGFWLGSWLAHGINPAWRGPSWSSKSPINKWNSGEKVCVFGLVHLYSSLFSPMFRIIEVERILVKLSPEPARQHLHLPLLRRPLVTLRANKRNEVRRTLTLLTTEILPFQETVADNRTDSTMPITSGNIHHVLTIKGPRPLNIRCINTNKRQWKLKICLRICVV